MHSLGFPFAALGRMLDGARDISRIRGLGDFDLELSRDADRLRSRDFVAFDFAVVAPGRLRASVHGGGGLGLALADPAIVATV